MIAENLRLLKENIKKKCSEVSRNPAEVRLIAVSKNFGLDAIETAFSEGQTDFGENKAQELLLKFNQAGNKITWHFIGTLQRNKVKFAVQSADYIHSVDSLQLAAEISKQAEKLSKVQKILLQVKPEGSNPKQSGISDVSELLEVAGFCKSNVNLDLTGLMMIAPIIPKNGDVSLIRKSFRQLRNLRDDLNSGGFELKELSMGMTDDYEIAIEEGSTMLRIGSAIFGQRDYSKNRKEI